MIKKEIYILGLELVFGWDEVIMANFVEITLWKPTSGIFGTKCFWWTN